ncbi:hypothetical protein M9H77_22176 [Catharanthus roseus]|uniref:Uncharacterized protein n=1 Tax=Catharanthus roseus TaxID=4058 RepID=A0ACC0ASC4_CATRO|nr:hypothetical protein M9H77_22176 [Catharanthus roseus]
MAASEKLKDMENQTVNSGFREIEIGKQGLRKWVLQKGNSWKTPVPGDEVEVHYSVRLKEGVYFDSSREKGTPFSFKLGQCEVIKGWDEGIATMKMGERSMFTVPPDLAYGEDGSPPLIPPKATLIFDIELLSWYSIRDITGDGGILKKIMKEGQGWATPKADDEVLVKYIVRSDDGKIVSESKAGLEFSLSDEFNCLRSISPAIRKALKTMRKGEKAELSVKYSYFCSNDGDCPSNSNLTIHLELVSWKNVIDVLGDKRILKKIIKVGQGFDRPNEGSLAKVIYIGKLEDGTFFESEGSDEKPFEYLCSEEQINEGLDRAVMTMKKGEQATVRVSADFLQKCEKERLASAATSVLYEVTLVDFIKEKPFWKMNTEEKLEACERKKMDGNALFREGKFNDASNKYDKERNLCFCKEEIFLLFP